MKINVNIRAIIFLLCAGVVFFSACSKIDEPEEQTIKLKQNFPDQESWGATITITNNGKRVAEVWAGYIAFYQKKNETMLRDSVHIDFYNQEGRRNSQLTADSGRVMNASNDLKAIGNVVVVSDSGVVLETEELNWDNSREKIISETPVKFMTETDTLYGDSFISDATLNNYQIENARGYSKRRLPARK